MKIQCLEKATKKFSFNQWEKMVAEKILINKIFATTNV